MISPFYQSLKTNIIIHVFKTNINTESDVNIIKELLNSNPIIIQWSIELEDIDKVLRIEATKNLSKKDIIEKVKYTGFYCEELE